MKKLIKAKYLESLYEVAVAVNSARTEGEVLNTLVKKVAQAMEAKGCSLMLLRPDRRALHYGAVYGLSKQYIRKGLIRTKKGISEALKGKPVAISDVTSDERIQYPEAARKEGIASILFVPIMLKERVIGVMAIYTQDSRHFSRADVYMLSAAANLGAIALENARLYEAVKKDYHAVQQEVLEWHASRGSEWIPEEAIAELVHRADV